MTPHYIKLKSDHRMKDELSCSRTKPNAEINHVLNIESRWRVSTQEAFTLFKTIALRWSHSATPDENQEDKLDWQSKRIQSYMHLDENQEDKLVLSRMLQEGL